MDATAWPMDAEREECEWLLTSGVLGRSGNLARVLRYVCEEHFQGRAEHIKEYTIAVEALGRRPDFDSQTDTIVRVTVHALRKRLMDIYQHEGAERPVHLVLPPGHYAPCFVHSHSASVAQSVQIQEENPPSTDTVMDSTVSVPSPQDVVSKDLWRGNVTPLTWCMLAISIVIAAVSLWFLGHASKRPRSIVSPMLSSVLSLPMPQTNIHALMGRSRPLYVDHTGVTWSNGNYCYSGTSVSLPAQHIEGTEDAPLYLGGVRGIVHCAFPVPQGLYELHFHFAEASEMPVPTHNTSLSINSGPPRYIDVMDEAGGHDIATSIIVTGVAPENDGSIHLDYVSEVSLLNAVEILAAPTAKQLPIRIVARSSGYIDDAKQVWASDRYFSGGRYSQRLKVANATNLGIYQSSRVGRFRYNIPAVPGAYYRVRLYFRDPWFRKDNGAMGGPGSRIFDVTCNGTTLLKNFDILAEGDTKPIVKTFENVRANADGRIELYFMPVVNYPAISAIEVVPED